ncbi:hypothetical protein D3C85_688820 [compost metagenome]
MKSAGFYIEKAEFLLEELCAIEVVPFQWKGLGDDFYRESLEMNHRDYFRQIDKLEQIKVQMESMFSEFGYAIFLVILNNFSLENKHDNNSYLWHLIRINELYIYFLYEMESPNSRSKYY